MSSLLSKAAQIAALLVTLSLISIACASSSLPLASLEENFVQVAIMLERNSNGDTFLVGKFTPTEAGYHLYSKDIPIDGVNGLGRPTLLALTAASSLQVVGTLSSDQAPIEEPVRADLPDLRIYPAGTVTLRLPVTLPAGKTSWKDEVAVTYMACQGSVCRKPVVDRIISIQIDVEK